MRDFRRKFYNLSSGKKIRESFGDSVYLIKILLSPLIIFGLKFIGN